MPLLGVLERCLHRPLSDPYRQCPDANPPTIQDLQSVEESEIAPAEQILRRHQAILESQLDGVTRPHAELVLLPSNPIPRRVGLDDEC